jgi:D-alanyl-D-alanine dipeptidase
MREQLTSVWATRLGVAASLIGSVMTLAQSGLYAQQPLTRAAQLVVVTTTGWNATTGELRRFVRDDVRSPWRRVGNVAPIVIGRTGLAWGVGFDRLATRDNPLTGPRKREGDGRSPAGVFTIGRAFGFAPAGEMGWLRLPYLRLRPSTECVDDTSSVHYNTVIDRNAVRRVDWHSSERMREIAGYRLGVIINYNASPPTRARGSCIFFHVWSGPHLTTAGCTALDATQLRRLAAWLDPRARPVLVQVPVAVYARLRGEWELPALDH